MGLIPKSFEQFGRTIKVVQKVKVDNLGSLGEYDEAKGKITIKKSLSDDDKEQTFLHELVHEIFQSLGYYELSKDEQLVDNFAKLLHQYEKTKK